jgi:2-oxoglutarate ferredoxin oxidoreductase subunit delta
VPWITVEQRYCKGCGLCVSVCPQAIIVLDPDKITDKGYHPAKCIDDSKCTGCLACAVICPDVAITVQREA